MLFELTNTHRKYLGLETVEPGWELVRLANGYYLYFDGDIIRKSIEVTEDKYIECSMDEATAENRSVLLPKTARGKAKKLTLATVQKCSSVGVYFAYSYGQPKIASFTTQTTYYEGGGHEREWNGFDGLRAWLDEWMAESTEEDLAEIERFRHAGRQHCKFREGDFFRFKIGRREYGFGRILLDIGRLRKDESFDDNNPGLSFMGRPLIVKVYHRISSTPHEDIDVLAACGAFPSHQIMDNRFYYGDYSIIGNRELMAEELEFPIAYGRSIDWMDKDTVYLQYGLISKKTNISKFSKYLYDESTQDPKHYRAENPYSYSGIGWSLDALSDIPVMRRCVEEGSNEAFWNTRYLWNVSYDLRNPKLADIKRDIFGFFGLDADVGYSENLARQKKL